MTTNVKMSGMTILRMKMYNVQVSSFINLQVYSFGHEIKNVMHYSMQLLWIFFAKIKVLYLHVISRDVPYFVFSIFLPTQMTLTMTFIT